MTNNIAGPARARISVVWQGYFALGGERLNRIAPGAKEYQVATFDADDGLIASLDNLPLAEIVGSRGHDVRLVIRHGLDVFRLDDGGLPVAGEIDADRLALQLVLSQAREFARFLAEQISIHFNRR